MAFSFSNSFNEKRLFDVDTSEYEFKKLEELWKEHCEIDADGEEICTKVFPVLGVYPNEKSMFGPQGMIATDEYYVNLPNSFYDTVLDIRSDPRAIKAINDGKVGFEIEQYYQKRHEKTCYTIRWVDM